MILRQLPPSGYCTIVTCGYCGVEITVKHKEQKCHCGDFWFVPKQSRFSRIMSESNPMIYGWKHPGAPYRQHNATWRYESLSQKELI